MSRPSYNRQEIAKIIKKFSIGKLISLKPAVSGKMNINLEVNTSKGKYLLKKYFLAIFKEKALLAQHKLVADLAQKGAMVVPPIKAKSGRTVVMDGEIRYVIFPFIDCAPAPKMSKKTIEDAAEKLAQFHKTAKNAIKIYNRTKPWPKSVVHDTKQFYRGDVHHKSKSVISNLRAKKEYDDYDKYVLANEKWLNDLRKELLRAEKKIRYTGADGAMLGRAIFGNPWLFSHRSHRSHGNKKEKKITVKERLEVLVEHTRLFEELLGKDKNFAIMKKHIRLM